MRLAGFVDARRAWRDLGARFDLAMAGLGMVTMLGAENAEGRAIFEGLRAEQHLRLLDRALAAAGRHAPATPA